MVLLRNCGLAVVFLLVGTNCFAQIGLKVPSSNQSYPADMGGGSGITINIGGGSSSSAYDNGGTGLGGGSDAQAKATGLSCMNGKSTSPEMDECVSAQSMAESVCLETENVKIQSAVAIIGGLMAGVEAMGLVEACSKQKKAMDIAKTAMLAYNLACGAAQARCDTACAKSQSAVQKSKQTAQTEIQTGNSMNAAPPYTAGTPKIEHGNSELKRLQPGETAVPKCVSACNGYKTSLAAGAMGLVQLMARLGQSDNCEDKTKTAATETPIDCKIQANKSTTKCICEEKPLSQGCPGQQAQFANGGINTTTTSEPATTTSLNDPNLQLNRDLNGPMALGSQSGGTNSGSGGSGAAGGAGSGGGSPAAKGADGSKNAQKSSLNPNILGGDFGGGGGGSRGGGGSDRDSSPYKPYMPGGSKDPAARGTASSAVEVTGAGGIDNWTKVNRVYQEARPTLMGK